MGQIKYLIRCKDLIIFLTGQVNFFSNLIGEKLSLETQFRLNQEDWNFKGPNLIFYKVNWLKSWIKLQENHV